MRRLKSIAIVAGYLIGTACTGSHAHVTVTEDGPSMTQAQTILAELQLTPDLLAASGVSASEASTLLGATYVSMTDSWNSYEQVHTQLNTSIVQLSTIKQQLKTLAPEDPARTQLEADLATTENQIDTLKQSRASYMSGFDLAATNAMSSEDRNRFIHIRSNTHRSVPLAYCVLDLSEEEWSELKHALAVIKTNEEPPQEFTQIADGYASSYEFNYANVSLQTHMGSVSTTFMNFLLGLQD